MVEPTGYCQLPSGSGLPHSLNFMLSGPPPPVLKKIYFTLCVCVCLSSHMYVYHVWSEEDAGSPTAGVTDGCEPTHRCWKQPVSSALSHLSSPGPCVLQMARVGYSRTAAHNRPWLCANSALCLSAYMGV